MGWFSKKEPVRQAKVDALVRALKADKKAGRNEDALCRRDARRGYPSTSPSRSAAFEKTMAAVSKASRECTEAERLAAMRRLGY